MPDGQTRDAAQEDAGDASREAPDAAPPPDRYPPTADNDGDGLSNELELRLHTDPEYIDTDGDSLSDGAEVGPQAERPLDTDGDGLCDAIESLQLDNDRDGLGDQADKAAAGDWQLVFGRFTPGVVANDGVDATTLEMRLVGVEAERVTVGMDPNWWFPLLAPDELRIDGVALGRGRIELFDDASHGDRIAGDGVFARDGITTTMKPRDLHRGTVTPRGEVMLGSVEVTVAGTTSARQLGYTDGRDRKLFPHDLMFRFVDKAALRPVRQAGADDQQTDYVLNIVDPDLSISIVNLMNGAKDDTAQRDALVALADKLPHPVDFLYMFPDVPGHGSLAGANFSLSNTVRGIGIPYDPPTPEDRGLSALILLSHQPESPIHHETMHQWGVFLDKSFGFDEDGSHHWGPSAGTQGVLGGFKASTLVDNGNGTYTVDRFDPGGGQWTTTPYSDLELYLMGLLPAAQVSPIPVLAQPTIVSGTDTTVTVQAQRSTVTIANIVAKHGARVPAAAASPPLFKGAFVIVSERKLTPAELAFIDSRARAMETTTANEALSFSAATRGLGRMQTSLLQ